MEVLNKGRRGIKEEREEDVEMQEGLKERTTVSKKLESTGRKERRGEEGGGKEEEVEGGQRKRRRGQEKKRRGVDAKRGEGYGRRIEKKKKWK